MKIAYLIPSLKNSGLTRVAWFLSEYLAKDYDVKVFYFGNSNETILPFSRNTIRISLFPFNEELKDYDIVHSHGFKPDLYVWLNRNKITGLKITTIHGFREQELPYFYGWFKGNSINIIWNFLSSRFDQAVCTVEVQEIFYKQNGFKNTQLIYNGVPKLNYQNHQKSETKADVIKISTLSDMNPRKGIDQILKVLALDKRYYLTAIGGEKKYIQKLLLQAQHLDVVDRCSFLEFVSDPWNIILTSDVFVFPSRSEGFGLALVEAAQLEIPIVCSDIPTFREIFDDQEVTFFKLDDIDDLYASIEDLQKLKIKVKAAKAKVNQLFTIERMASLHAEMYQRLFNSIN